MSSVTEKKAHINPDAFDYLEMPAFVVDKNLAVLSCNLVAEKAFGYKAGEIVGRTLSELVILVDGQPDEKAAGVHHESACRRKNGELFAARVTFIPYPDGRRLVVTQDISDRKKLQQRAAQRTKELSVINNFAAVLTSHSDTKKIMQKTIDMLLPLMEADAGWIYLFDDETGKIHLKARKGLAPEFADEVRSLKPGECFNGKVFASGRSLLVKKMSDDPRITHRAAGMESMIGVPISSRGVTRGVLGVASRRGSYFTSLDAQLLSTIGSLLGVAIENTGLIAQLQNKVSHIKLINELSGIINSSLSIGTLFRIMVSEIRKLIDYSRASLLLYNEKKNNLLIFALDTKLPTVMKKGVKAPIKGTSAGWVITHNKPWINNDLSGAAFPLDRKLFDEGIRSTISIPLYHDKIIGVFNLDSTEPGKYSEKDLQILLPAAKHISVALENALLFEQISREKREWEKTFDAITDMVWIEDGWQRVIRANRTLLQKTGLSAMEASGKRCSRILEKIGITGIGCLCKDTLATHRPSFTEIKAAGGNIFDFWTYPLIDEEGRLYAIVHYVKDVTAQKRLEQQLIRSDRLASLGTLVAGIAHEINNPLGIIAGYSEALIDRAKDKRLLDLPEFEDFPEYLTTIHSEIFRCKGILRSLLDFARPSSSTFREIDINELIKEVILLVNHKAKRLSHNIELRLNRDLPVICADPGSLRQLFMNIIINSIYYTPQKGSIVITTGMDDSGAGVNNAEDSGQITVSVTDTGSGIPADVVDKVFDPFFTTKPVGDGTGLGLAICHKIVEEHGGSIDVESREEDGTTFVIKLPTNARDDKDSCRR
ncbi:MAG: GAF domain-containing protein [Candidatus Sulfobium sp.]|jgi:two-component system NtrC family sensor kinase